MSGTVLENLSGKKISVLVAVLLILQVVCFLIGGIIAPKPDNHQMVLALACKDQPGKQNDTSVWYYTRGKGKCAGIPQQDIEKDAVKMANQLVYVFQVSVLILRIYFCCSV